jgi:hypothetical protein
VDDNVQFSRSSQARNNLPPVVLSVNPAEEIGITDERRIQRNKIASEVDLDSALIVLAGRLLL